ncbi:hypothetical protein [Streptomyces griseorubiginosus]
MRRTNDETLLPDGVLEKVRPLFDKPDANRAPPVRTPSPTR